MSMEELDFLKGCLQVLSKNSEKILAFQKYLETDFEKKLFEAAINNLLDIHNPLRFNNFSYAMRELMDHILRRLAPDDYVKLCSWYECPDGKRKVIRSQRIKYAIQKGLSDDFVSQELGLDVLDVQKKLKKLVKDLNKYTHVTENTFDIEPIEQLTKLSTFLEIFLEMFEIMENSENEVINAITEHIEMKVIDGFFSNYIWLEEYATHVYWGDYEIEDIELEEINYEKLRIRVSGVFEPQFQFGSDSDIRKGYGLLFTKRIPFVCILTSSVESPYELQVEEFKFDTNDSNFWEDIQIIED
jgi:hypothetical protein